jgi:hypothetical protein
MRKQGENQSPSPASHARRALTGLGLTDKAEACLTALPELPDQSAVTVPVVVAIMCQAEAKAECFQGLVCSRCKKGWRVR